jgi:prepilin-type processing-associated H-X9-DG protein
VRPAETAFLQDNFTGEGRLGGFNFAFGCEGGFRGAGHSRHHLGCNYIFLDGHAKLMNYDIRREPTMPCPGALSPATGQSVPDCVCTRYTTYDY